jgi:hypothetical protein
MKVLEDLNNGGSLKTCALKHNLAPKDVQRWRLQIEAVLQVVDMMYFLACRPCTRKITMDRGGLTPQYIGNVPGAKR